MNSIGRIARQELKGYFVTPIGYVVLSLFSVLEGWFFFHHVNRFNGAVSAALQSGRPDVLNQINLQHLVVEPLFREILLLLSVFLPAVAMRFIAEEKKQKTLELLLTSPLDTWEIVLGKYVSGLFFLAILLGLTVLHPALLFIFGRPGPDLLPVVTGYAGLFLAGAAILSVGLFASCLTENQIIAFVVGLFVSQFFLQISRPAPFLGGAGGALLRSFSLQDPAMSLARAFVDTRGLVYLVSFTFFWLLLSHRAVEQTRWR